MSTERKIGSPPHSSSGARTGEAGFTLIEVLCASGIAALALTLLLQGFGGSLNAVQRLDDHVGARIVAQSVLADARQAAEVRAGSISGSSGKYRWRVAARPAGRDLATLAPPGLTLYRLEVRVTWSPRGTLELSTVKLAK